MTAVTIPEKTTKVTFKQDVERWKEQLATLCSGGFTPERILSGALTAGLKNPQIFDCEPTSIFLALAKAARLRLDVGEGIDLVPLNNTVKRKVGGSWQEVKVLQLEAWTSYRGLKALAARQGIIRSMDENVVYAGDEFDFAKGLNEWLRHKPCSAAKRGVLRGAYSVIRLPGGAKTFHWMPIEDIEVIRVKSKQWNPDKIRECPPWYAQKTVVRDYLSRQPQAGALAEALSYDDTTEPSRQEEHGEVSEQDDLAEDQRIVERDGEDGA